MIKESEPLKFWWDVFVLMQAIIICWMLPIEVAFEPNFGHTKWWKILESCIEFFFCCDLLAEFNTSQYDKDGNEVFSYLHIAHHHFFDYLFWSDILATIPLGVRNFFNFYHFLTLE